MTLKGAAHAAAAHRRLVAGGVISETDVAPYLIVFLTTFFDKVATQNKGSIGYQSRRRSVVSGGENANDDADVS